MSKGQSDKGGHDYEKDPFGRYIDNFGTLHLCSGYPCRTGYLGRIPSAPAAGSGHRHRTGCLSALPLCLGTTTTASPGIMGAASATPTEALARAPSTPKTVAITRTNTHHDLRVGIGQGAARRPEAW
jgi:hypothetical protein